MRRLRFLGAIFVLTVCFWMASRAWGIGFFLGETKDQLKLKYDLTVQEHASGRVTVVFTLADEGRLKPLDEVELAIPSEEKNPDGVDWMDLVVPIELTEEEKGKRVGRVHLLKKLAARAELHLNTHTMDGKLDPLTRLHHVIPLAGYLTRPPKAATPRSEEGGNKKAPPATSK